jgi:hypothetical protein
MKLISRLPPQLRKGSKKATILFIHFSLSNSNFTRSSTGNQLLDPRITNVRQKTAKAVILINLTCEFCSSENDGRYDK